MSSLEQFISKYFRYLNHALVIGIILVLEFTFLRLFVPFLPVISDTFPERVRGPLANPEYYELGELEPWESVLDQTDENGRRLPDILMGPWSELDVPPLEIEEPPQDTEEPANDR